MADTDQKLEFQSQGASEVGFGEDFVPAYRQHLLSTSQMALLWTHSLEAFLL
jgi:hypothetical protein